MGAHGGPNVVNEAAVFYYDTANQPKSFAGEPTTNSAVTNMTAFTSDNGCTITATGEYFQDQPVYRVYVPSGTLPRIRFNFAYTTGQQWNGSIYYKVIQSGDYMPKFYFREAGFGSSYDNTSLNNTEWTRANLNYTFSSNGTCMFLLYRSTSASTQPVYIDFAMPQLEVGKTHATQFITGTRSSTQGLLDLTRNRTIELANVSFNSSAEPEFDGSNDVITFGGAANIVNKSYTIEAVFNRYSANRVDGIIGDLQYHWFSFYITSNNELYFFHRRNSPYTDNGAISAAGTVGTGYYHAVGVFDISSGMRVYLNGNLVASNSNTTAFDLSGRGPQYIGQHRGGAPSSPSVMSGQIPMLKIYEGKALTAEEVQSNYLGIKSRYGL